MALALGTNAGFVTTAPVADPAGGTSSVDNRCFAVLHTVPAGYDTITEVGWWCDTATEEANFDIGLYADAGNNEPEARAQVSADNAKGTGAGWKVVNGLSWSVTAETAYWIAVQLDNTATTTSIDTAATGGSGWARLDPAQTALPSDWGTSGSTNTAGIAAIYALVTASGGGGSAVPIIYQLITAGM